MNSYYSCRQRFTWSWGSIFVIMRSSKRLKVKTCSTYNWWAISSFMGLLLLITFWKTREKENFRQMENIALLCRYYFPFLKHHFCFIFITLICIICMKEATQIITLLLLLLLLLLLPTTFPGLEEINIFCIYYMKAIPERDVYVQTGKLPYYSYYFRNMYIVHLRWGWLSAAASVLECEPSPTIEQNIESP